MGNPINKSRGAPLAALAIATGKLAGFASKRARRGGGTALPGLVAERVDRNLLPRLTARLGRGSILVTGTNGKTTTSGMLAAIARAAGWQTVHNHSGSNLMRGLIATLIERSDLLGRLPDEERSLGIFEVDEATLLHAIPAIRPRAVVFTNLFRDQLDRYGEVDAIVDVWRRALKRLSPDAAVVLNADDPSVAGLSATYAGKALFYGLDDRRHAAEVEHAADARWCHACGSEYRYDALYYGHIGLWECPGCGVHRPNPQISAGQVDMDVAGQAALQLDVQSGRLGLTLPLSGLYNVYNALAATAGAHVLGLPLDAIEAGLASLHAAFGRQEQFFVDGREVRVLLCKNPAGANQILRTIVAEPGDKHVLILLNDGIADGRDISWIWDVDYELLARQTRLAVASGRRATDLALRLKYAGLAAVLRLEEDDERGLSIAISSTPAGGRLYILPTYTAMLRVRDRLARLGGRAPFWKET